jgi:hypothetical protein
MIRIAIGTRCRRRARHRACRRDDPLPILAARCPRLRTIDGRKCWYAGRRHIDRSRLAWRGVALALPPKREPSRDS